MGKPNRNYLNFEIMKKIFPTLLFLLLSGQIFSQQKNKLNQTVYYFGPTIDSASAKVLAECDCCTDNILFINEKEFVAISYCMADKTVSKGNYTIQANKVILYYDGLFVNKIRNLDWDDNKKGKSKYSFKSEKTKSFKTILTPTVYKNKLFYITNDEEVSYGTIEKKSSINVFIKELKSDGLWQRLFK